VHLMYHAVLSTQQSYNILIIRLVPARATNTPTMRRILLSSNINAAYNYTFIGIFKSN